MYSYSEDDEEDVCMSPRSPRSNAAKTPRERMIDSDALKSPRGKTPRDPDQVSAEAVVAMSAGMGNQNFTSVIDSANDDGKSTLCEGFSPDDKVSSLRNSGSFGCVNNYNGGIGSDLEIESVALASPISPKSRTEPMMSMSMSASPIPPKTHTNPVDKAKQAKQHERYLRTLNRAQFKKPQEALNMLSRKAFKFRFMPSCAANVVQHYPFVSEQFPQHQVERVKSAAEKKKLDKEKAAPSATAAVAVGSAKGKGTKAKAAGPGVASASVSDEIKADALVSHGLSPKSAKLAIRERREETARR